MTREGLPKLLWAEGGAEPKVKALTVFGCSSGGSRGDGNTFPVRKSALHNTASD